MGEWSAQLNEFYMTYAMIFDNAEFENLVGALEGVDAEQIRTLKEAWKVDSSQRIRQLRNLAATMPAPPKLTHPGLKPYEGVFTEHRAGLTPYIDEAEEMMANIEDIAQKAIEGDISGLAEVSKILVRSGQNMIRSENTLITSSSLALPEDHPNRHLMNVIINLNSVSYELLETTVLSVDGDINLQDREDIITKAQAELSKARSNLKAARKSTTKTINKMRRNKLLARSANDKHNFDLFVKVFESFQDSIAVETNLANIYARQLTVLRRAESLYDLEDESTTLDSETYPLIDERLRLQGARATMVSKVR